MIMNSRDLQIAAIYCRLSKEDMQKKGDEAESESIQNQKLLLVDYALKKGFVVYKIYIDEDYSGFAERPDFKQMINDAEKGLFNVVICKNQSRFTRNMEFVEKYIHGLFVEWGVRFIGLTDNVDTSIMGGKKARQINGLINEWHSEDLSENIKAVLRRKMNEGQFLGSFACYGYERDPNDRHKIVKDIEAAHVVKEIFELYLRGYGVRRIAVILTERGIETPSQYKKSRGLKYSNPNGGKYSERYGVWSNNTIRRILRNETYIGTLLQGREKKVSFKSKKVRIAPKDEWVVIKNNHEPIINEKDFYAVQRLMDNKRTGYEIAACENHENAKAHVLAGRVYCLGCGASMHRSGASRDGKVRYLRCKVSDRTNRKECPSNSIVQQYIEDAVISEIQTLIKRTVDEESNEVIVGVYNQIKQGKVGQVENQKRLEDIKMKIDAVQKKIIAAYDDKLEGVISESDYSTFRNAFEVEKEAALKQKRLLEAAVLENERNLQTQSEVDKFIKSYRGVGKLTHETVNEFVKAVYVGAKNPITNEQEIVINWLF